LLSLDEEIKVPRGSSKGFFNKLIKKFTGKKKWHSHTFRTYTRGRFFTFDLRYFFHIFSFFSLVVVFVQF
jgi:hypothetical protein